MGYVFAADSIYAFPCILKQAGLKTRASTLNDSTRKTVFNAKWLFKVIQGYLFQCQWKAIGGLHIQSLRHNDFGLIYEISKDIATARNKNGNFRRHHSHLMPPIQRTPMNVCITLMSSESPHYISAAGSMGLSLFKFLWRASNRQAHNVTERIIVFQGHPRSSILVPIESACTYP